ncbi:MAG: hypothetical protein JWQ26_3380 [Modestobacter sp.]|nr:hypothetical protein [Modestobacter sp.]
MVGVGGVCRGGRVPVHRWWPVQHRTRAAGRHVGTGLGRHVGTRVPRAAAADPPFRLRAADRGPQRPGARSTSAMLRLPPAGARSPSGQTASNSARSSRRCVAVIGSPVHLRRLDSPTAGRSGHRRPGRVPGAQDQVGQHPGPQLPDRPGIAVGLGHPRIGVDRSRWIDNPAAPGSSSAPQAAITPAPTCGVCQPSPPANARARGQSISPSPAPPTCPATRATPTPCRPGTGRSGGSSSAPAPTRRRRTPRHRGTPAPTPTLRSAGTGPQVQVIRTQLRQPHHPRHSYAANRDFASSTRANPVATPSSSKPRGSSRSVNRDRRRTTPPAPRLRAAPDRRAPPRTHRPRTHPEPRTGVRQFRPARDARAARLGDVPQRSESRSRKASRASGVASR